MKRKLAFGRLLDGQCGAYAVTEPSAGSDVAAIKTRAERRGDRYVINGSKVWISNAPLAQFFVIFAKTDPAAGHRGISAFFVDRETSGRRTGASRSASWASAPRRRPKCSSTDVEVPVDRLVEARATAS